jgi:uncharacterized protein YecT (DUF1311 family)
MSRQGGLVPRALLMSLLAMLFDRTAGADSFGVGAISGEISYPGDTVPALRIYALSLDGRPPRMIPTPKNETKFTIEDLPVGRYYVVGYPYDREGSSLEGVAWTRAARCIKGPCDHSLIEVKVVAAKTSGGVLLADWYVPGKLLPPDPGAPPRLRGISSVPECEREPTEAARDACHQRATEAADQTLNQNYQRVMKALQPYPKCHDELRNAQYAWLRFRDEQCSFEGALEKGRGVRCLRELTEARAAYLQGQTPLGCAKN